MPRQAIAYSTNQQRSKPLDAARLVNLYAEQPPTGSRAPGYSSSPLQGAIKGVLYGTPGLKLSQTLGAARARAGREALGFLWALYGTTLYRVDKNGTAVGCTGDAIIPSGAAMMSDNGQQLVLLAGGKTYVVGSTNATGSFTITGGSYDIVTDPDTGDVTYPNSITDLQVNDSSIIDTGTPILWRDSNEATAGALGVAVNAMTATSGYSATTNGATIIIKSVAGGKAPNGFGVVPTLAGNVTITPPGGSSLSGGADSSTTVTQVSTDAYPTDGVSSIDYVDGYIVSTVAGTIADGNARQWFLSALYDASTINALGFATAESASGNLMRVLVSNREVWLFSGNGVSVWADAGTSPFPFQRIPGATMEKGCGAALSPADLDNTVFWLGADLIVYMASGYTPVRISTHGIEEVLRAASDVSDAYGMTYTMGGHHFYVLTCSTLGRTLVYDATAQSWHERQSGTALQPMPWLVRWIAPAFGKIYAGLDSGQLCILDLDTYQDAGTAIRRVAVSSPLYADGKRATISAVEFECELGVGITQGQGSAPEVMLRISRDGGNTWGNERRQPLGPMGKRKTRAIFKRLGIAREFVFEFSISDPVKIANYGMRYEPAVATS